MVRVAFSSGPAVRKRYTKLPTIMASSLADLIESGQIAQNGFPDEAYSMYVLSDFFMMMGSSSLMMQPLDDLEVPGMSRVVHGVRPASLLAVRVEPLGHARPRKWLRQ